MVRAGSVAACPAHASRPADTTSATAATTTGRGRRTGCSATEVPAASRLHRHRATHVIAPATIRISQRAPQVLPSSRSPTAACQEPSPRPVGPTCSPARSTGVATAAASETTAASAPRRSTRGRRFRPVAPRAPRTRPDTARAPIASSIPPRSASRSPRFQGLGGASTWAAAPSGRTPAPKVTVPWVGCPSSPSTAHSMEYVPRCSGGVVRRTADPFSSSTTAVRTEVGEGSVRRTVNELVRSSTGSPNHSVSPVRPTAARPPFGGSERSRSLWADAAEAEPTTMTTTSSTRRATRPRACAVRPTGRCGVR